MRYYRHIILGTALLISAPMSHAGIEINYVLNIAKQIQYAEQNQNVVWPGFHPNAFSSIIEFNNHHAYALNYQPGLLPWRKLPVSDFSIYKLIDSEVLHLHDIHDDTATIEGQISFIQKNVPKSIQSSSAADSFMVERAKYFLINESEVGKKHQSDLSLPYDAFNNAQLLKLYALEGAVLLSIADTQNEHTREPMWRDALAIHQYRNSLLNKINKEFEHANEIYSALPVFISLASQQLDDQTYLDKIAPTNCFKRSDQDPFFLAQCLVADFSIYTTAVYARMLEQKTGYHWKKNTLSHYLTVSQTAINAYALSDAQAEIIAKSAMKNPIYDYEDITTIVDNEIAPYIDDMNQAKKKYDDKPGVTFEVDGAHTFFVFLSSEVYLLDTTRLLLENVSIDIDDVNINIPHLVLNFNLTDDQKMDEEHASITYKIKSDGQVILDGIKTPIARLLSEKKVISFHRMEVFDDESRTIEIFDQGAILDAHDGVTIKVRADHKNDIKINASMSNHFKYAQAKMPLTLNKTITQFIHSKLGKKLLNK